MANNRLYLYCPACNEALSLGKHFGGMYTLYDYVNNTHDIQDFIDKHRYCLCSSDNEIGIVLCEEFGSGDTMTGVELPDNVKYYTGRWD